MEVYGLLQSEIAEDSQHVILHLETDRDAAIIEINADALKSVLRDLAAVTLKAQEKANPERIVSASTPPQFRVLPDETGQAVILSFRMESGLEHHFALPPNDARLLQRRIGRAVERCR